MSLTQDLKEIESLVPVIKEDRNYWFVRTEGGNYYQQYINGGYIAIDHDSITLSDIKLAEKQDDYGRSLLTEKVKKAYPDEARPGHISSQLIHFTYGIKKGDIVIIPSAGSAILHFGEVQQNQVYLNQKDDGCPFEKRKKVKWLKWESKYDVDSEIYKLIFNHVTVSVANQAAPMIDRTINDFFIKGDTAHLVLAVNTPAKIPADIFYDFGEIFRLVKEFCNDENIPDSNFNIKSKVQSEGILEITTQGILGVIAMGVILMSIVGGGFSLNVTHTKDRTDVNSKVLTDGIIEKIRKALNSKNNRKIKAKIVEKAMEDMKITTPEDLGNILDKLNDNP